jgi:hypothetical protein
MVVPYRVFGTNHFKILTTVHLQSKLAHVILFIVYWLDMNALSPEDVRVKPWSRDLETLIVTYIVKK